jgi:hypothetical protein
VNPLNLLKSTVTAAALATVVFSAGQAYAHSPLFDCFDNGDGTILCEGGFSDGSSASGVSIHIKDKQGNTLEELKMNADSEVTFNKPSVPYSATFDAGEGHRVTVDGENIVE